jgi:uncharacterized lipoprotein YddW (UPF0748 family)
MSNRTDINTEGKPSGWDHIDGVRIAAYRAGDANVDVLVRDIRAIGPPPAEGTREAARAAVARVGQLASFNTIAQATNEIARLAGTNERVAQAVAASATARQKALNDLDHDNFSSAEEDAAAAAEQLERAYCLAQKPQAGELRGFWCHSAYGPSGMTWDEAIHRLSQNGFNAIFPNMLWGGAAFYPSKVLPVAGAVAQHGDAVRECLEACRKYGVQIHVWKVNWNLGSYAPKDFVQKMRQEGRLQASAEGKEEPWLCPSHPENQKLESEAMLELVRNYDIDGIHFDYIRYPDAEHCFCAGCRERFERASGVQLTNWPQQVLAGGALREKWLDWRRENITRVVATVSEKARAIRPKIKISAAVFRYWNTDRDLVGQDWKIWCDKGYLDFVCPMDYTPSLARFENMVSQQVQWAGRVPCYPGLGVSASSSRFGPDRAIEEINLTRRYQTHGFLIFNYSPEISRNFLPQLGMGITAKP